MRTFHSYGPVDTEEHYYVGRKKLVGQCTKQLVGSFEKGGHYFTIWGARQTGKTWLYRQSLEKIKNQYENVLTQLSVSETVDNVTVNVVAIGQG